MRWFKSQPVAGAPLALVEHLGDLFSGVILQQLVNGGQDLRVGLCHLPRPLRQRADAARESLRL